MDTSPAQAHPDWCHQLYDSLAAQLLLYGRSLGLSHGEAEDVLHDTFVALLNRKEAPENPHHYCLRTFRHRALNHRRTLWRRLTRNLESTRWFEPPHPSSPFEDALLTELQRLPAEQREVVVLKIWHRLTFAEIAQLQHCSPNTASGRYRYALEKLRISLESHEHESLERPVGIPTVFLAAPSAVPSN
ncbi:MAG TPA: sigma-70 family RNA polymerase sigma factor [Roseimicrobium sp.]|nr:sigma-70 family RNA polymerase sigma factor [Roseimicrobium sp.]